MESERRSWEAHSDCVVRGNVGGSLTGGEAGGEAAADHNRLRREWTTMAKATEEDT
jgi:hypothetical protein